MYLHLGQDMVVRHSDIIGIFDIDNTTISKITKSFLAGCELRGEVVNVCDDLPKSYVICENNNRKILYITQISCATLKKRSGFLQTIANIDR